MTVSHVVELGAEPEAVWDVLLDFEHYERWTKAARVTETGGAGKDLVYILPIPMRSGAPFPLRMPGRIKTALKPSLLVFELGLPGILALQVGHELTPKDSGAELRHFANFTGVAAPLCRRKFLRTLSPILEAMTISLAWRFSAAFRPAQAAHPNRRQRRMAKRGR